MLVLMMSDEPHAGSAGVQQQEDGDEPRKHQDDEPHARSAGVGPQDGSDEPREHQAELEQEMDAQYGPRNERYDMQQHKERDYSHLFMETVEVEDEDDSPLATPQ
jgi:hypothetical protein